MDCLYCPPETDFLDIISKVSSIVIAGLGLLFSYYIFKISNENDNIRDDKSRQYDSLKTIILEHNLKHFFNFYEEIMIVVQPLSKKKLTDISKSKLNDSMVDALTHLRLNFTDLLLAVDTDLYTEIMKNTDDLIDELTEVMFDEGIVLTHNPKFESEIISRLSASKTNNVKILYSFNR